MKAVNDLSEVSGIAYQAFLDMGDSKTIYFRCLETVEAVYESGGVPGDAEKQELERLLADHDKNVLAFKAAMAAVTDSDEKHALLQLMT